MQQYGIFDALLHMMILLLRQPTWLESINSDLAFEIKHSPSIFC